MAHEATVHGIGLSMDEGGAGAPVVLLEARDEIVPIFIGADQAQAIERGRRGLPSERPLTHDLFITVLDDVDTRLDRVRIDDLRDDTFYAKLDLVVSRDDQQEKVVRDARPSDAIALAVRIDCPVTIADSVIDEAGISPDQLRNETTGFSQGSLGDTRIGTSFEKRESESGERDAFDETNLEGGIDIDIDEPDDEDDSET